MLPWFKSLWSSEHLLWEYLFLFLLFYAMKLLLVLCLHEVSAHDILLSSPCWNGQKALNLKELRLETETEDKRPVQCSMHPESSREADDLTVRAGGAAGSLVEIQGCEPRTFCQLAQPAAMTGSQPSDMVVPLLQKTCATTTARAQHTHMLCLSLWGTLKGHRFDLRCIAELTADRTAVSTFAPSVTSVRRMNRDQTSQDVMSALQAYICMKIILCRCTGSEIYSTIVLQVQSSIFTTLLGFISFSHSTSSRLSGAGYREPLPPKPFIRKQVCTFQYGYGS